MKVSKVVYEVSYWKLLIEKYFDTGTLPENNQHCTIMEVANNPKVSKSNNEKLFT